MSMILLLPTLKLKPPHLETTPPVPSPPTECIPSFSLHHTIANPDHRVQLRTGNLPSSVRCRWVGPSWPRCLTKSWCLRASRNPPGVAGTLHTETHKVRQRRSDLRLLGLFFTFLEKNMEYFV